MTHTTTRKTLEDKLKEYRNELLGPEIDGKHHISMNDFFYAYQAQDYLVKVVSLHYLPDAFNFLFLKGRITEDEIPPDMLRRIRQKQSK